MLAGQGQVGYVHFAPVAIVPLVQDQVAVNVDADAVVGPGVEVVDAVFFEVLLTAPADREVVLRQPMRRRARAPVEVYLPIVAHQRWAANQIAV